MQKKINQNNNHIMLTITSYEDFAQYEGKVLGTSDYVQLTQERINLFADATLDHQWIHVDTERAKTESQFGTTIAHGYKMKFGQPVLSGQSLNLTTSLQSIVNLRGAVKTEVKFTMNVKETGKKAIEGIAIFIYYFNN